MILKDKTVIITGGTRGLGKELCLEFAKNGCNVIFTYSRSQTESKKVKLEIEKLGVTAKFFKLNLLSPDNINQFCEIIKKENINFDFLINNAASGVMKNSIETTEKHWDWTMQVNVKGPWLLSKNLSKNINKKGKIINISSPGSTKVLNNYFSIGVSKAALESLTRYMAYDLAKDDISVNSISASLLETDAIKHFPNQEEIKSILSRKNPKQKKLIPNDVAKFAVSLCSEAGDMVIGQNILIDGGDTLLLR
ncbi:MAG: SDR family oxidoreductase [SAR202 cluster bacterium]|nr:SDR family oxidoreductase [SAR202 cluster bacterium]RZP18444.1 MAG: SDR family oxidoreductase [Chloroflexota bacterium]|tara:strand:+ start:14294 stop:15046 length:753 start_codon:yes stop_codon:yes gene_type:complete